MRAMMDRYGQVVHLLTSQYGAVLVDTQAAMDAVLESLHPMTLALDRVHPVTSGHMVFARAFMQAIDVDL